MILSCAPKKPYKLYDKEYKPRKKDYKSIQEDIARAQRNHTTTREISSYSTEQQKK
jgi:hypothetical protein